MKLKSFKRFMSEAGTRVGSSIFKLSKAEMKELRRIVKKSGSKALTVSSLAARPKVARDMIRKHGDASVLEEQLIESLMKAEFKTPEGAAAFAKEFAASGLTGRVTRTKKVGRVTEVEFLAMTGAAKKISSLAKKNKGSLTFMG